MKFLCTVLLICVIFCTVTFGAKRKARQGPGARKRWVWHAGSMDLRAWHSLFLRQCSAQFPTRPGVLLSWPPRALVGRLPPQSGWRYVTTTVSLFARHIWFIPQMEMRSKKTWSDLPKRGNNTTLCHHSFKNCFQIHNLKGSITILGGKQDLTTLQVRGGRLPEVKKVAKAS